jgi:hypothetical protein
MHQSMVDPVLGSSYRALLCHCSPAQHSLTSRSLHLASRSLHATHYFCLLSSARPRSTVTRLCVLHF